MNFNVNFFLFFSLFIIFNLFLDQTSNVIEKNWDNIKEFFYDPSNEDEEDVTDFTSMDESVIQVITETDTKFADVAGNEEAKDELKEVVRFLKEPSRFTRLGATIPKGVLLGGPPGTGKTLLAKAIAGEAGVPFLRVSGSQFVEMLVGVGAGRVRDLFEKARSLKPSIIFIDEIDSIARSRSSNNNMGGGNDERDQTLNQILTEMDGFKVDSGVVVIGATNRIDILDPAIKRPGRFDRQITMTNPNLKERQAILKVHARGKKLDESISVFQLAQRTAGFSGADIANLLNEAAILATRRKKKIISTDEVNTSIDRMIGGLEGKPIPRAKVRQLTAFHEMGHALMASLIDPRESIEKLSIIPRGNKRATSWKLPSSSQYTSREMFIQQALIAISGRASEEIIYGEAEVTAEGQDDIAKITRILRTMILRYAMTKLQELKQDAQQRNLFLLGSDAKQELSNDIDNFTTHFMQLSCHQIVSFLEMVRPEVERLVDQLLVKEELSGEDLRYLAQEYFSNIETYEPLYESREAIIYSLVFDFLAGEDINRALRKEIEDVLKKTEEIKKQ
jgi:cell division protease FtsH